METNAMQPKHQQQQQQQPHQSDIGAFFQTCKVHYPSINFKFKIINGRRPFGRETVAFRIQISFNFWTNEKVNVDSVWFFTKSERTHCHNTMHRE